MKNAWKWILGILIILVIVAALVAVPIVMRNYMLARTPNNAANALPQGRGWNMMPGYGTRQGQGGFSGRSGPMMGVGRGFNRSFGGGFSPFGFGFMFLGGFLRLIPWILLALLFWGVYQLGRRSGLRSSQAPAPVEAAQTPASSVPAESETPQNPVV